MKQMLSTLAVTLVLTACASSSEPHLTQEPVKVNQENISDYWISNNDIQFEMRPSNAQLNLMKRKKVEVIASYIVDSNGDVFDIQILESNVDVSFANLVEYALDNREFEVAKNNVDRQPIIATSSFVYEMKSE